MPLGMEASRKHLLNKQLSIISERSDHDYFGEEEGHFDVNEIIRQLSSISYGDHDSIEVVSVPDQDDVKKENDPNIRIDIEPDLRHEDNERRQVWRRISDTSDVR